MALNLNTELGLINTTANSGSITLPPASSSQGRVITFKDAVGQFGRNSLTLVCSGSDKFEDGATSKVLRENNGIIQVVASGTTWYILTGTQQNTTTVSTLQALNVSSVSISSGNLLVSSLQYDKLVPIYQQSSLVYFNSNVFAGSRVYPATTLNRFSFSLYQIFLLNMWLDGADSSTVILSGSTVARWNDKSPNSNYAYQVTGGSQPTYSASGIVFNTGLFLNTFISQAVQIETIFFVLKTNDISISQYIFNGTRQLLFQFSGLNFGKASVVVFNGFSAANMGTIGSNPFIISITYDYVNATCSTNINGGTFSSTNSGATITNNPFTAGGFQTLGAASTSFQGTMYEVIQYNAALVTLQRQQVEGYLAWKWGLQANLPANHPYKNAPP